jgi:hypothetical protein
VGACYYACSFCSFAKTKFVLHSPLKEPKGQNPQKSDIYASYLACLVFLLICEVSSMFVLAIFRSQKDNKHSCAILFVFDIFGNQMEQQKIVLYTLFVEFFGKQTKLQKLCCMHLGFGIFRNQMGQQKLVSSTCFFGWGWGKVPTSKLEFK